MLAMQVFVPQNERSFKKIEVCGGTIATDKHQYCFPDISKLFLVKQSRNEINGQKPNKNIQTV